MDNHLPGTATPSDHSFYELLYTSIVLVNNNYIIQGESTNDGNQSSTLLA
jgi:hypothetical protein